MLSIVRRLPRSPRGVALPQYVRQVLENQVIPGRAAMGSALRRVSDARRYTINRRHIFPIGNKRMSTLCLLTFLRFNNTCLYTQARELTEKALWLAIVERRRNFPRSRLSSLSRGSNGTCSTVGHNSDR
jgi:hypothetical protein